MNKDVNKSTFDFDIDPEFDKNFNKNIDKIMNEIKVEGFAIENEVNAEEKLEKKHAGSQGKQLKEDLDSVEESANAEEYTAASRSYELADDELIDINASLAQQICEELKVKNSKPKKKKMPRWQLTLNIVILVLLFLVGSGAFLGLTKPGHVLLLKMGVNLGGNIWETMTNNFNNNEDLVEDTDYLDDDDLNSDATEIDASQIVWPDHPGGGRHEDGVYNILLLGEEAIGSGSSRGRTDVIIIATLNTKQKSVKLTSLLRDTLVQIPGYKDNKLNSAYEKGGIDLMYETIAQNYDIQLDGSVLVNFKNFEKIIDELGGLEITLTKGEAKYLNTTNYISNPKNRNVVEGKQHMNGNQVLGYARVRKRATITGNNNDYGRTDRHRIILNAIFEKYKSKNKVELATMMLKILPMITTDIDKENFEILLNTFIEMGTMEIEQLRLPADGTFTDNVKVRGMDVLIPDLRENVDILHEFVFGKDTTQN